MATWPGTLPDNFLQDNFSEKVPENVIRTPMDIGPPKMRQRSTAASRPISGNAYMTTAQVAIHDTFFVTTLSYGSLRFDWTHPRTGAAVELRYVNVPIYTPVGVGWNVTLNLEILP